MSATSPTEATGAMGYGRFTRSSGIGNGHAISPVFETLAEAMAWGLSRDSDATPWLVVAIMPDQTEMLWSRYQGEWQVNMHPVFTTPVAKKNDWEVDPTTFHAARIGE